MRLFNTASSSSCFQSCLRRVSVQQQQIRTIMNHTSHSTSPYIGKFNPKTRPKLPLPKTSPLAEPQLRVAESSQGIIPTVRRSANGNFPVYLEYKSNKTAITTILRKIDGPAQPLFALFKKRYPSISTGIALNTINNTIVFRGKVRQSIIEVLKALETNEKLPEKRLMKAYKPPLSKDAARSKLESELRMRRAQAGEEAKQTDRKSEEAQSSPTMADLRKQGLAPELKPKGERRNRSVRTGQSKGDSRGGKERSSIRTKSESRK